MQRKLIIEGKKMIGVTNPTRISKHTKHGTPTQKAPIPIPTERRNETELLHHNADTVQEAEGQSIKAVATHKAFYKLV